MKVGKYSVTLDSMRAYFEGNIKAHLIGIENLPIEQQEQIYYRMRICRQCLEEKECKQCFCELPERFFVDKPEEPRRCDFPDFMDKDKWEEYKKVNNLLINN